MSENLHPNVVIPSTPHTFITKPRSLNSSKCIRLRSFNTQSVNFKPFDSVPDKVITLIFNKLSDSDRKASALVCKRWLGLLGTIVKSIRVLDWGFLLSWRLVDMFKDLKVVDLVDGCVKGGKLWNVVLTHRSISIFIDSSNLSVPIRNGTLDELELGLVNEDWFLSKEDVDEGLKVIACGLPKLRKLVTVAGTEIGLLVLAEGCSKLQELELHRCSDNTLRSIAAFEKLQTLRLNGNVGYWRVTDTGLTILAQGCTLLMKLELGGCEGGYDGIKAIGQCCQVLEELIITDHKFDDGWLAGIPYCQNLKKLSLRSCKNVDDHPDKTEEGFSCLPYLEHLHLQKCWLRKSESLEALFKICKAVEGITIQDCWGFTDDGFISMQVCRWCTFLSLEGCSLITTAALESVVLSMGMLGRLKVVSCKNVKNSELSLSLSALFRVLLELKWMPDRKTLLSSNFTNAVGRKGGKFFRR